MVDRLVRIGLACLVVGTLVSCGEDDDGPNATQLCKDMANAVCDRLYDCFSSDDLAAVGYPATSSGCKSQFQAELGCDAAQSNDLCEGNESFHSSEADKCISQTKTASCSQLQADEDYAPACDRVCTVE